jgi:hypothetical protein
VKISAIIVMLGVASAVAHAGPITDISVSGSVTAGCGSLPGGDPVTVSQTGVSAISFGISDCFAGDSSVSATTTTFTGTFGDVWGAYMVANGASQISIDLPANTFGYVEVAFTGTSYGLADPDGLTGDFSGLLSFSLGGNVPIFANPYFDSPETISGAFQSADFLTGASPAEYTVGSSWEAVAASTESFYAGWNYSYTVTFVDPPDTFIATPESGFVATPEPGTGFLSILGFAAFAIRAIVFGSRRL